MGLLQRAVALPRAGEVVTLERGGWQLVLEGARGGGVALLAHDGRRGERLVLGTPAEGTLALALVAPLLPLRVRLRERLALMPGTRLRGYVRAPLVLLLGCGAGDNGAANHAFYELRPASLRTAWCEDNGVHGYVHVVESPFLLEHRAPRGEAEFLVPLFLHNDLDRPLLLDEVSLAALGREVREVRGCPTAMPRRLRWSRQEGLLQQARAWPATRRRTQ
ncbi:MAG: hypothetical protein AAF628_03965 [Planctomycetota bacterium]